MRSTVRPNTSPCRMPVPAAKVTAARQRSGMAAVSVWTAGVSTGTTRTLRGLGTETPTHGDDAIRRSSTAALNTADRRRWITLTVAGASVSVSVATGPLRSEGRMLARGRSPRVG